MDWLSWGSSFNNSINPPYDGQSMVHWYNNYYDGENNRWAWYKDEPPTPGTTGYPTTQCTIIINVHDQFGAPIANVPIYRYNWNIYEDSTDVNGVFTTSWLPGRYKLKIKHPQTGFVVRDQQYWVEPNQTVTFNVMIDMTSTEDEVAPAIIKGLQAYPNPFYCSASGYVSFTYDGDTKLSRDSYLRVYDTKGRFIQKIEMNSKGTASWQPAADTASGPYLARLISGNRILDTTTLTIVK
jgi:hypothetical protein